MKQFKHSAIPFGQKQTFIYIFLILVLVLMAMPFVTTFNDLLTRLVMRLDAYRIIQNYIVPWEVRMVGVILYPFGFQPSVFGEYLAIGGGPSTPFSRSGQFLIEIAWNCIGWQSLLFFLLTAWVGLQGDRYSIFQNLRPGRLDFWELSWSIFSGLQSLP